MILLDECTISAYSDHIGNRAIAQSSLNNNRKGEGITMARKAQPVEEVEEDEVELEELSDEVDDEDEAPAKGQKAAKPAEPEVWGVRQLIALIKEKTGTEYKPREVRTLLRKLAREDGTIDREIVAGNKSRYSWSGPSDPEVKAVLKAVKGGEIEAAKKAALDKLKADKAAQNAAKAKAEGPQAGTKKGKAAPPPADDDDEDDDE